MRKSLPQTGAYSTKWTTLLKIGASMTKWGNAYCKGQLCVTTKKEQELLKSGTGNLFQIWASLLKSRASITN